MVPPHILLPLSHTPSPSHHLPAPFPPYPHLLSSPRPIPSPPPPRRLPVASPALPNLSLPSPPHLTQPLPNPFRRQQLPHAVSPRRASAGAASPPHTPHIAPCTAPHRKAPYAVPHPTSPYHSQPRPAPLTQASRPSPRLGGLIRLQKGSLTERSGGPRWPPTDPSDRHGCRETQALFLGSHGANTLP